MQGNKSGTGTKASIEPSNIATLMGTKQTQFYSLWVVFAAVQLAIAGFGQVEQMNPYVVVAALVGFWAFNLGHLGFVLACQAQADRLRDALRIALTEGQSPKYDKAVQDALLDAPEALLFWRSAPPTIDSTVYRRSRLVHLLIDICASGAFLLRISIV